MSGRGVLLLLLPLGLVGCGAAPSASRPAPAPVANSAPPLPATSALAFDLKAADRTVAPPVAGDLARYLAAAGPAPVAADLVATIGTSLGVIRCVLDVVDRPITVANFVGLATGLKAWTDPRVGDTMVGVPFYDGLTFHRVIRGFMIQGGDPLGTGQGGPGYRFDDELTPARANVRLSLVMANAGPNTNGSQFFVNQVDNGYLDGKYTVFGQCDEDETVDRITDVAVDGRGQPDDPVFITGVTFGWR